MVAALNGLLQRLFWSVYGRLVFDGQSAPARLALANRVVALLQTCQAQPGERVLDAGCGTGIYTLKLAEAGFHVVGVDFAHGMLDRAQAKVKAPLAGAVSYKAMDLNGPLAFTAGRFDHVICLSVLQSTKNPVFTLAELWRVLKPGGRLVLLHWPKPEWHRLSFRQEVRLRVSQLERPAWWGAGLVALKAWAERTGHSRYWTLPELEAMLVRAGFRLLTAEAGPPIIVAAAKTPDSAPRVARSSITNS